MNAIGRFFNGLWALRPRRAAAIVALVGIGLAFRYAISEEMPVGRITGQVYLDETHKPLDGVDIYLHPVGAEGKGSARHTRYAETNEDGTFTLAHVPAGEYQISASAKHHEAKEEYIFVDEGGATKVTLALHRSESDLQLAQHQRVFGTKETPHLSVRGYVDSSKPSGQDTLRLHIYKTRLSTILQDKEQNQAFDSVGRGYDPAPKLPAELLKPQQGRAPTRIVERDVRITEDDKEGFFYQKIDFGKLDTGLYLIDIDHADAKAEKTHTLCAWALVTDTALVVKRAGKQFVAFTADMTTGLPTAGSAIRTYRNGKVIAEGQTDSRGLAEMTLPGVHKKPSASTDEGDEGDSGGDNNEGEMMTVAVRGNDEAVISRNSYYNEALGDFTAVAYTDRPIYRPGQHISFKGIARRNLEPSAENGTRYSVPTGEPINVEIRDPSGERILQKRCVANSFGSFYGAVDLTPEAPTGVYSLIMNIGGERETHDIVVASYSKPEYKVTVTPDKKRYTRGETVTMTIAGEYYFGSPVAGAKVRYSVYRAPDWASEFPDDYEFDPSEDREMFRGGGGRYYGESVVDGETNLDENGKAVITFPTDRKKQPDAPQTESYTATVTVVEQADRESSPTESEVKVVAGDFRLTISPEGYVGSPGQPTNVVLTTRDYDGKPVPNVAIDLETGYEKWDRQAHGYHYQSVGKQKVTTGPDGRVLLPVTPPRSGEMRLKARAYDAKNHLVQARTGLWVSSDRGEDLDTEYADLSLLTDKRRYNPGDTARVLINTARVGQTVLLTIEGEKVYTKQLVPITQRSTVVRVPVLAGYGPNIFLSACYVRDKKFAKSEASLRVTTQARELKVSIRADRETGVRAQVSGDGKNPIPDTRHPTPDTLVRYKPGDTITYQVQTTDTSGRPAPCELSFGVVDESIYALKEDDPTALRDAFYPRRTNRVDTQYSFAIEYLGDADKAEPLIAARKKFLDTAYWDPVLRTDSQGHATVRFALPDNLTTWRATAIGHTLDTRLGRAVNKVIATKDFFVRVEKPRFLTQHDGSRISVFVHNETGIAQTALVRLRTENLTITDDGTRTLALEPGKIGEAVWNVQADGMGDAKLRVTAWTPKVAGGTQYTDGVETSLPIRPHGREQFLTFAGQLTNAPETEVIRLDPKAILNASHLTVRITPSLASAMTGALDYLIGFPYGCTEQTMSRFLPDLLVQRALKLKGLSASEQTAELPRMVRAGLQRLYRFQHKETGGWGWWEHDQDDAWMTAYVLYGLAQAQAEGYPVSKNVLANGRKAAVKMAKEAASKDKAFLLYALALTGEIETARAQRPYIDENRLGPEEFSYLILLDKLLGRSSPALWAALDKQAISADGMVHWKRDRSDDWDDETATAVVFRAILATNRQDSRIFPILRWLMLKRTGSYWSSTRATSWILTALCDYLAQFPLDRADGEVKISLNGRVLQTYALANERNEKELVLRVPASALRPEKNDVLLERTGGGSPIFYAVQFRQTVAMEDIPAFTSAQIGIKREYLRVLPKQAGHSAWTLQTEATKNLLKQGDNIRVRLTLTVPRDMSYVLIEDPFPSGCEVTERGTADEVVEWGYWWSSVDIRDDRIAFFARELSKGEHIIEYNLRAQTPGSYHTLPTLLQAMYAPESKGESAEARIEVK